MKLTWHQITHITAVEPWRVHWTSVVKSVTWITVLTINLRTQTKIFILPVHQNSESTRICFPVGHVQSCIHGKWGCRLQKALDLLFKVLDCPFPLLVLYPLPSDASTCQGTWSSITNGFCPQRWIPLERSWATPNPPLTQPSLPLNIMSGGNQGALGADEGQREEVQKETKEGCKVQHVQPLLTWRS